VFAVGVAYGEGARPVSDAPDDEVVNGGGERAGGLVPEGATYLEKAELESGHLFGHDDFTEVIVIEAEGKAAFPGNCDAKRVPGGGFDFLTCGEIFAEAFECGRF